MLGAHPTPQTGRFDGIRLDNMQLSLAYNPETGAPTYEVDEANRFGDKIAEGDPKYADFAPYESASAVGLFNGTYGLRAYADSPNIEQDRNAILEADGIDCSYGIPIVQPLIGLETPPGNAVAPAFIGEFTPQSGALTGQTVLVVIAGTKVYYRKSDSTWTLATTLSGPVSRGAQVTVFNNALIIGMESGATAVTTTDLSSFTAVTNSTGTNIYIFAVTSDHSTCYVAGGTGTTDFNDIMTSITGNSFAAAYAVGRPETRIVSLAPGGGLVLLYVGKWDELGMIDNNGVYRSLIPFDTRHATNGGLLQWWLGRSNEQDRGPLGLHFVRDRMLWEYGPSSQDAGEARNITPWALPGRRPPNIKGIPTAILGTPRWLFYSVQAEDGTSWIMKRDAASGATTPWLSLGAFVQCNAMGFTTNTGLTNPVLAVGYASQVGFIILPREGDFPPDDDNCRYKAGTTMTLDLPEWDLGLPDEDKVNVGVRVLADDLLDSVREIEVQYGVDGGSLQVLGTAKESPRSEILFDAAVDTVDVQRMRLRLVWTNTDAVHTPQLRGVVLRWALNIRPYKRWTVRIGLPVGRSEGPGSALANPDRVLQRLWALRTRGLPIEFVDRWRRNYSVRLISIREVAGPQPHDRAPETLVDLVLLEATGATPYSVSRSYLFEPITASWYPITEFWPLVGAATLDAIDSVARADDATMTYPRFVITGPSAQITLTNLTTGQSLIIPYDLPIGETIRVDMSPTRETVTLSDGTSLTSILAGLFWGFGPGNTSYRVTVVGADSFTSVVMTRRP